MENYLEILQKIANGKNVNESEKTDLINYCENKGFFNSQQLIINEQKYNFLTSPFIGDLSIDCNFLFPSQLLDVIKNDDAIAFLNENKILNEQNNPIGITYVFSCFKEEQKIAYNKLDATQKGIFLGYMIACGNHYQPAGYNRNENYQKNVSNFLERISKSDLSILDSLSQEKLVFYGKEYFIYENILPKNLMKEQLIEDSTLEASLFQEIDKNFIENVKNNLLEKTNAITPFTHNFNNDVATITRIFSDREFSDFGYDFNIKTLSFSGINHQKVISNTYYPKEILEKQKERVVNTLNKLMNYDINKLTDSERTILTANSNVNFQSGKVNILEELRNFDNYTEIDANIFAEIILRTFKEVSGIPNEFEVKIQHNNNLAEHKERGVFTPSFKPYFQKRKQAEIQYLSYCYSFTEDSKYPSTMELTDRTFINTTPVLFHEMEHLYQEYLMQELKKNKLNKDSAEYKYANLCLIAYYYDENLQYLDKTYELGAFAIHELTHDLLGYNFNDIFQPTKQLDINKFNLYDSISDLDLTTQAYNFMLKESTKYADEIFQDIIFSGAVTPQDMKNLGINIGNSTSEYYFDKSKNMFSKEKKENGRN